MQKDVDAIYCAVPQDLHVQFYSDIINAGKHLMGEKPFGIDLAANRQIMETIERNPKVFVRCSSEPPFYPGGIAIIQALMNEDFGQIIEVESGLLHSSDINPQKPINWKRMIDFNGEYGCMGDLGMHALHIPLRLVPAARARPTVKDRCGTTGRQRRRKLPPPRCYQNSEGAQLVCSAPTLRVAFYSHRIDASESR
jgi:predicted dehydrogenase